jgi:serine/threonine protein kinase/Tol biopolymer transport system component
VDTAGGTSGDSQDVLLGKLALERKFLTPEQLREALAEQAKPHPDGDPRPRSLGNILVERGLLSVDQLVSLIDQQGPGSSAKPGSSSKAMGKYTLVRVIGRGGMGVVYEAIDTALDRKVALKTMLPNPHAEAGEARQEEERFLREAKLSATLAKHPNIVSVYEAGVIDEKRYLAMELIEGRSLARWRSSGKFSLKEQVSVLRDVAAGVHHAHQQGVIHRDLKPENILIDAKDQPHVTDFGLAKMIGQNVGLSLTAAGMAMGTPAYMSPEQAQGLKSIDGRTDVYSMGVMLYEMLTGRQPFTGETPIEILMKSTRQPVPRPTAVVKPGAVAGLDSAIENICLKALAKNPQDRYRTAEAFAQDLSRWLSGEDVKVVPPTTRKTVAPARPSRSRPRILAALAAIVVVAGIAFGAGFFLHDADPELVRAQDLFSAGKYEEAREAFHAIIDRDPKNAPAIAGRQAASAKLEVLASRKKLEQLARKGDKAPEGTSAPPDVEPPGSEAWKQSLNLLPLVDPHRDNVSGTWTWQEERLVSDRLGRTRIELPYRPPEEYDLRVVFTRTAGAGPIALLLSRSGRSFEWVMGAGIGGTACGFETVRGAWAANNPSSYKMPQAIGTGASHIAVAQVRRDEIRGFLDGALLSRYRTDGSDLGIQPTHRLRDPGLLGLFTQGTSVSFERAELLAVTGKGEAVVQGPKPFLKASPVDVGTLKPGLIGEYCSGTAFEIPMLRRIDASINFRWGEGAPWPGGPCDWFSCRWTGYLKAPKVGDYTFMTTSDEGIRLTLDDLPVLANWVGHFETTNSVSVALETGFHKISIEYFDESLAATAVLAWTDPVSGRSTPIGPESFFHREKDFRPLAPPSSPGLVAILGPQPDVIESVAFSPDGSAIASGGHDRQVRIWDWASGKERRFLKGGAGNILSTAFSPDGQWVAAATYGGRVKVWNEASTAELLTFPAQPESATCVAWSPDGKLLAAGGADRTIKILEVATRKTRSLVGHNGGITSVAWSRDQKMIASAAADGSVRIWDAETGSERRALTGHSSTVSSVAWGPDGKLLVSGGYDKTVRIWNSETGRELRTLSGHTDLVRGVAFRGDGTMLASCSRDTTVRLWDLATGQELKVFLGHTGGVMSVAFSPDGRRLASSGLDATIRIWDVK